MKPIAPLTTEKLASQASGMRWVVCTLLLGATVISYIDRQAIAIAAPVITREFSLNNKQLAQILSSFLIAYTFGQLAAGRFFDWIGGRKGFTISVGFWSAANAMTAWATGPFQFSIFRFLLGLGEAGNFPGGIKIVAEWFSPRERAFAGGLFASGASLGVIVAAPLLGMLIHAYGWRSAFYLTSTLGFLWVAAWLSIYRTPASPLSVTNPVTDTPSLTHDSLPAESDLPWAQLWGYRQVWALTLGRLLEEPILWFCIFWLPTYFVNVRGISLVRTGFLLTQPYIALDLGYIAGGWISKKLIQQGVPLRNAKLMTMSIGALLMTGAALSVHASSLERFVALISLATLGHGAWYANVMTMPADFTPHRHVASVYGITALGGGIGGIIITQLTGTFADHLYTLKAAFIAVGIMPLLATLLLFILLGKMTPISPKARKLSPIERHACSTEEI